MQTPCFCYTYGVEAKAQTPNMRIMTTCMSKTMNGKSLSMHCTTRNWLPVFLLAFFCCVVLLYRLKKSGEQVDDRIVEVHWDPVLSRWRMMRFRNDKPNGNHISVVENIIQSIAEGVEQETLVERSAAIRTAWKLRLGQPQQPNPPQTQQQQAQVKGPPPLPRQPLPPPPAVEIRFGPFAQPLWSKVSGPPVISGMKRWKDDLIYVIYHQLFSFAVSSFPPLSLCHCANIIFGGRQQF